MLLAPHFLSKSDEIDSLSRACAALLHVAPMSESCRARDRFSSAHICNSRARSGISRAAATRAEAENGLARIGSLRSGCILCAASDMTRGEITRYEL